MARNRSGARVSRGTPRKKIWARQTNTGQAVAAGAGTQTTLDLLSPLRAQLGLTAGPLGLTVMRIRGKIVCSPGSAAVLMNVGIRVFTRSGADAGASLLAVDGPSSDPHADWMLFTTLVNDPIETDAGGRFADVDVRSMRKLQEVSDSLCISFDTPDALGGVFRYTLSVLVALP